MKNTKSPLTRLTESVDDILEIVDGIAQNMVTKVEFNEFRLETNKRFDDLEIEIAPHSRRLDRLEDKVRQISTKIGLK